MRSSRSKLSIHLLFTMWWRLIGVASLVFAQTMFVAVQSAEAGENSDTGQPASQAYKPLFAPVPGVTILNMPGQVDLGSEFTFTVRFDNTGDQTGYGPYIDLYFPVTGADGIYPGTDPSGVDDWTYDGIDFISASYLGSPITTTELTFGPTLTVSHPYYHYKSTSIDPKTGLPVDKKRSVIVSAPAGYQAGDKLVVLQLPFGSFVTDQPAIDIVVTAKMSDLADLDKPFDGSVGNPAPISAGGGYQFGATELDDWCCEVPPSINSGVTDSASVSASLLSFDKQTDAPEGETATGPSYPHTYTATVDVAEGQELAELTITDSLPNNIVYLDGKTYSPAANASITAEPLTDGQPHNNSKLTFKWCLDTTVPPDLPACNNPVINGTDDASFSFDYYVSYLDADGNYVVETDGTDDNSCNDLDISYTWIPKDTRDGFVSATDSLSSCTNVSDEALVLRKGSINKTDGTNSPGDIIEYTLNFEVSDYFAINNLILTDVLSDGQHFDPTFTPKLTINQNGASQSTSLNTSNVTSTCDYSGAIVGPECNFAPAGTSGSTTLVFSISEQLKAVPFSEANGRLFGACVNPAGNPGGVPDCSTSHGLTTGSVTYRAIILDEFTDVPGDPSVDQGDSIHNTANGTADILDLLTLSVDVGDAANSSSESLSIDTGKLVKSIYAINNDLVDDPKNFSITPGDTVTYRLTYSLPTSDVENMLFDDYLPLPVFRVNDPDGDGTAGPAWSAFDTTKSNGTTATGTGKPAAGTAMLGPSDTFFAYSLITPAITTNVNANKITFTYGTFDDPSSVSKVVDILFTLVITSDPFADGLFLTNQSQASESNTVASGTQDNGIVKIEVTEPAITEIKKAAVSSDNPAATLEQEFDDGVPFPLPPVTFESPGTTGLPWTGGMITSSSLPFDAGITLLDGGDKVRFAIIIENQGSGPKGAFDLTIKDTIPGGLHLIPDGADADSIADLNIQIYNGAGDGPFTFTAVDNGPDGNPGTDDDALELFDSGIMIDDPDPLNGACQSHTIGAGKNIIVITYDLQVDFDVVAGQIITNKGELTKYASTDDGKNFLDKPLTDYGNTTVGSPSITKTLFKTGIEDADNSKAQAVIGEYVYYDLRVTVPEGGSPDLVLTENIPANLAYVGYTLIQKAADSDGALTKDFGGDAAALPVAVSNESLPATTTGGQLILAFDTPGDAGTELVVNPPDNETDLADSDPTDDAENDVFIVRLQLYVPNLAALISGVTITNNVTLDWTDENGDPQSESQSENSLTIIEPALTVTKTSNPAAPTRAQAHDTLEYTIVIENTGVTDAFDVTLGDVLPRQDPANPSTSYIVSPVIDSVTDSALTVTAADFEIVDDDPGGTDGDANGWILQTTPAANIDLAVGQTVTIVLHGTLALEVTPEQILTNTATAQWTSLDDEDADDGQDSDERTGADGVGGALDDYAAEGQVDVQITRTAVSKYMVTTSEAHTTEPTAPFQPADGSRVPVTIGEIVRYRLLIEYPESTSTNFRINDYIPNGMTFLNDGTAKVAFFSNNGITSTAYSYPAPSTFTIAAVNNPNCQLDEDVLGPVVDGVTPAIPAACPPLADNNVSRSATSDSDAYKTASGATSRDVLFLLGTLVNQDNDPTEPEYIIIEFNALVDNNGDATTSNDAGEGIFNRFRVYINGNLFPGYSNSVYGNIVEPSITDLAKAANPTMGDAGDTITYTLTFSNGSGTPANDSTAFDVVLTDTIHADMTANLGVNGANIVVSSDDGGGAACATGEDKTNSSGNSLDVRFDAVPVGCTVTLTYTATLNGTVTADQVLDNTADLTYTSLPGDKGTASNPTGSTVEDGNGGDNTDESGGAYGERDGSATGPNDYNDTDSATVTANALDLTKSLVGSSNPDTVDPDLTIGEIVTYRLSTVIPEGTSLAFAVTDTLPAGFTYVADSARLSFIADDPMTVPADIAGADNDALPPTFSLTTSGRAVFDSPTNTLTVTLGDLVNNDRDNIDSEYVVVEFDVLVNNTANNNNTSLDYNFYNVEIDGATKGPSNSVETRIVEPFLDIAKSADDDTWVYGQTVEYTLDLTHISGSADPADDSNSVAYDIVVTDTIPTGLTFDSVTSLPANWTQSYTAPDLTLSCLSSNSSNSCSYAPADGPLSIIFTATVDSPPAATALAGTDTATNDVTMTWTSMPAANPDERSGDGVANANNDYLDTASHDGALEYYSLGNRVWFDADNNSQIDAGELGVSGVTVQLFDSATGLEVPVGPDGKLGTPDDATGGVITDASGYYLFDYLEGGDYIVVIPESNFATAAVLEDYWSSDTSMDSTGVISETAAPDADTVTTDSDDNGTLQPSRDVVALAVTLGPTGLTEPTGETDLDGGSFGEQPDGRANMTVDFGFYRASIGDQVYMDDNFNGTFDSGTDQPLGGVAVRLYVTDGTTTTEVANTTSDAVSGQYLFPNLPEGNYIVTVEGPANTASTVDTSNLTDTTTPDTNQDHNDNGVGTSGDVNPYVVSSNAVPLRPGWVGNSNTVTYTSGETFNPTLDFGFVNLYNLGNRVWFDTDNSSTINDSEVGVDGVTVQLYAAGDLTTVLDTDTTASGGYYIFENLYPGNYVVTIPSTNFGGSAVLEGYWSSATYMNADGSLGETAAPDPDLGPDVGIGGGDDDLDSDDNGTLQTGGMLSGAVTSLPVTLGPVGNTEPQNDDDLETGVNHGSQPDGRSNLSVDFGFYKTEIGNLVFGDVDKDGKYSTGDSLLDGVKVQLFVSDGTTTTEVNVGPDGILGTTDDALTGVLTNANGWSHGEYRFSGLPAGDYIVRVTAPNGTVSTIDTFDLDDTTTIGPDINSDDNDNGQGISDGVVTSGTLTMTPGYVGDKSNNIVDDGSGTQGIDYGATFNPTVDFGFTTVYALGNRVWYDTNDNNTIDNGETGVDNVLVQLYAADASGNPIGAPLASDTTANGGYYLFGYLEDGRYVVVVPVSNFGGGAVLEGYWSTGSYMKADGTTDETPEAGSDTNLNSDDNGTLQIAGTFNGAVVSSVVTLGPGAVEPTSEDDLETGIGQGSQPDSQANMTVDFGFYTITLGDLVWDDANIKNNGLYESATESGINDVTVELYAADSSGAPTGPALATVITGSGTWADGEYQFTGLPASNYILRIPESQFQGGGTLRNYYSSTGNDPVPSANNGTDSDDNGDEVGILGFSGGYIQTSVFSLTPGNEDDDISVGGKSDNSIGLTSEPRVDFGVYKSILTDLSITKTDADGKNYYLQGGTVQYTITVSNNGPADVTDATVSDPIPTDAASNPLITSWDWACTSSTGVTIVASGCSPASALTTAFSDDVTLPYGASITYTVTATIADDATGDLFNEATVTVPIGTSDTDSTNNTNDHTDIFSGLTVTKDDGFTVVAPGSEITYKIKVKNDGKVDLTNLTITDTLPAEVDFVSASPAPVDDTASPLVWKHANLVLPGANPSVLAPGESTTITLTVRVKDNDQIAGTVGSILNSVHVEDANGAKDDYDDEDSLVRENTKSLLGTNHAATTTPEVTIGEILTYRIQIEVPAGVKLDKLKATDTLDSGLSFDECIDVDDAAGALTSNRTDGLSGACPLGGDATNADPVVTNDGHTVVFSFGDVTNNADEKRTLYIDYYVVVLDDAVNTSGIDGINNTVTWSWDGGKLFGQAAPVEIVEPELSILKTVNPEIALINRTVTYTIEIAHTAVSSADAYDVVVTDIIPVGMEYVDGSFAFAAGAHTTTDVIYDAATRTLTMTWDEFPLLATSSFTFDAIFIGPSPVVNEASVAWTSLPIDPQADGTPVVQSEYNKNSTERWYDPLDNAGINNYLVSSSATVRRPALPKTGFAPGRITPLPSQSKEKQYLQFNNMMLEVPRLGAMLPIVGIPTSNQGWDLTWLSNQAGWLEGTAYPTLAGNTGLTAHTYLADGTPGPFVNLISMRYGDRIYIHANGSKYTYEVREVNVVSPQFINVLGHEEFDWITLITCREYNEQTGDYNYRVVVRAVLVNVKSE